MKKVIVSLGLVALVVAAILVFKGHSVKAPKLGAGGGSGLQFYYTSATTTRTTVNPYTWTTVSAADSSRGYLDLCNNSISSNDAMYLGIGATSTAPFGIRVASGNCYEMTATNMFFGNIYAIASTATSTLLMLNASY